MKKRFDMRHRKLVEREETTAGLSGAPLRAACALAAGFLLAGLLLTGGCGKRDEVSQAAVKASLDESQAVLVSATEVVQASSRRLEAGVSFSGELKPQDVTEVIAYFDGDLQKILVREGQKVRKGQPLAVYRPRDVKDAWKAAEAALLSAKAGLVVAQNAEKRAKRLLEAGAASPSDLEAAQAARAAAAAQVSAAEAMSNRATDDTERLDVPSPISGWVSKVIVHSGDRTAIGDRLITLVNTDTLELDATLPSEALGRVQVGTPIRFRVDPYPDEEFTAKVDRINPTTEPGTRQVRIYNRVPNPDGRLVGGLYAGGRVVYSILENALAAPIGVLRREGPDQVVYRLHNGRAARIPVETGILDEKSGMVQLIGPIAPGDSLLTGVLPGIRDGVMVRVLAAGNGGGAAGASGNRPMETKTAAKPAGKP